MSVESPSRRRLDHQMGQEVGSSAGAISTFSSTRSALYASWGELLSTSTSRSAPVAATTSETDSRDRPSRQRHLTSVLSMYAVTLVAFSPAKEGLSLKKGMLE
ncbi:unnamed protein product [Phytophthora fragariaefolia]|uniref:Unnamed protein product n=1 Tax=Phytophthora fragariaefolia TaxID=1490495 RepID=A0A9W7D6R4_9STRA|nr:unnamed protein product [Phytophthora fragariaefolia]